MEMHFKATLSVLIALFILLIAQTTSSTKENTAKHHLTIVYTNDVQGEIEPCG
jgi:2',3'-cyclic-nucleotide 2'-phosphodiesterase (5'-nucleotidase family)